MSTCFVSRYFFEEVDVEGELFEGDIVLGPYDTATHQDDGMLREKRNARRLRSYVWQSKIIPYEISAELGKLYSEW